MPNDSRSPELLAGHLLVLASRSPRRAQLLEEAGYRFEIVPADESVEDGFPAGLEPERLVVELALAKARAVAPQVPGAVVLGADTVAELDGQVLGKPLDADDARRILSLLSGRRHRVLTGLALVHPDGGRTLTHLEESTLRMARLAADQLSSYIDSGQWQGKAGAFGYQDGLDWVELETGLASNVVGLPVERLPDLFQRLLS